MADTTTIGTQGYFGTVTSRIASIGTFGYFLVYEGANITRVLVQMQVYVPSIKMSAKTPGISITAKVPAIKISVTKDN